MNKVPGKYYTNTNQEILCDFEYTHTDFFKDIYNKQNNIIPIDIDMYQYIENDNYISNKLPIKLINYIGHFFNKHNCKFKFYVNSGNNLLIFCDLLPNNVSQLQKNIFIKELKKYNISDFLFIELV